MSAPFIDRCTPVVSALPAFRIRSFLEAARQAVAATARRPRLLQEMYLSPDLSAAQPGRTRRRRQTGLRECRERWTPVLGSAAIPRDCEVCGRATWRPGCVDVTPRNPSDALQDFALDLDSALELPVCELRAWNATGACEKAPVPRRLDVGCAASVHLVPLQVIVSELTSSR